MTNETFRVDGTEKVGTPNKSPIKGIALTLGGLFALAHVGLLGYVCLLYTSPSPRDRTRSRMPSSA